MTIQGSEIKNEFKSEALTFQGLHENEKRGKSRAKKSVDIILQVKDDKEVS